MIQQIIWHYYGADKHAIVFYHGTEFLFALHIAKYKAEKLISLGMNHGT